MKMEPTDASFIHRSKAAEYTSAALALCTRVERHRLKVGEYIAAAQALRERAERHWLKSSEYAKAFSRLLNKSRVANAAARRGEKSSVTSRSNDIMSHTARLFDQANNHLGTAQSYARHIIRLSGRASEHLDRATAYAGDVIRLMKRADDHLRASGMLSAQGRPASKGADSGGKRAPRK